MCIGLRVYSRAGFRIQGLGCSAWGFGILGSIAKKSESQPKTSSPELTTFEASNLKIQAPKPTPTASICRDVYAVEKTQSFGGPPPVTVAY